ncbi:PREDICTED: MAPK/MAK/MRK overlapping kinase-like isoform X3 [Rhinopithecus bieti]|uniref:MAPK/MAK/MRK overlapping kinase-like isoform X3 n=1 Tax=Rhinopithecus bieti TaxID=61621 RepID=UPI00083BD149|nr:PREDICTED: MAPK/MAK/MRK overlapping kinase-like isoform X3 [Rhinopithecus bieti]
MKNYKAIGKIGEGTFSEVMKMQSLRDGNYYACKQMKQRFESVEQVNNLREIQALRRLNPHPNILTLHEVVFDRKSGSLALICELMDMNIYELIRGRRYPLSEKTIMHYMYQLCKSLDHIHRNGIFHRDVKPENILIKQDVLKLGDFGSCRSVYSKQPYTEYISTRWYRAPECLLTDGFYTYKMDLWSAGCVFYEIASKLTRLSFYLLYIFGLAWPSRRRAPVLSCSPSCTPWRCGQPPPWACCEVLDGAAMGRGEPGLP